MSVWISNIIEASINKESTTTTITNQQHMARTAPQSRNWCFTYHLTADECALIGETDLFPNWNTNAAVKYLVYQLERAPHTGIIHAQGFINLKSPRKLTFFKKLIANTVHAEIAHDVPASILYCQKSESRVFGPWIYGAAPEQGKRTDLATLYDDIKAGKRTHAMLEENPAIARYEKQIKFMRFDCLEAASDRQAKGVHVSVFWGSTETGKTFSAINLYGADGDYFKIDCTNQKGQIWFDGYEGQRLLIIDDFDATLCSIGYMKVLLDKYKLRLPIKGGHVWAAFTQVIITSNSMPNTWYIGASEADSAALARRLHHIRHYESGQQCLWREESFNGLPIGDIHQDVINLTWVPAPALVAGAAPIPDPPQAHLEIPAPLTVPDFNLDIPDDALMDALDNIVVPPTPVSSPRNMYIDDEAIDDDFADQDYNPF